MNKEYKDMLSELHFSEEQKENMVDRLMRAQLEPVQPKKRRRPIGRTVAAIAAVAAVMSMGAGAVYSGLASDAFSAIFGTEQTEIIDKIGKPLGVSDTDAGITVTADAILGDEHNLNVVFTLTKDDGSSWDITDAKLLSFGEATVRLNHLGGSHGGAWFVDEDPNDNQIQYVEQITVDDGNIPMGSAKASMSDLTVYDSQTGDVQQVIEGSWNLRFDVQYEDSSVELLIDPVQVATDAGTATVTEVRLSPVGFRVSGYYEAFNAETQQMAENYEATSGREPDDSPFRRMRDVPVVMTLKNGETVDLGTYAGGSANMSDRSFTLSGCYESAIYNLDDVESVTVGDVTLPMTAQ